MKRYLRLEIVAGDKTCYSAPNVPCPYIETQHWGSRYFCAIFNTELRDEDGHLSGPGLLQRTDGCLQAESAQREDSSHMTWLYEELRGAVLLDTSPTETYCTVCRCRWKTGTPDVHRSTCVLARDPRKETG